MSVIPHADPQSEMGRHPQADTAIAQLADDLAVDELRIHAHQQLRGQGGLHVATRYWIERHPGRHDHQAVRVLMPELPLEQLRHLIDGRHVDQPAAHPIMLNGHHALTWAHALGAIAYRLTGEQRRYVGHPPGTYGYYTTPLTPE